jgi:flagellar L-ring protein precursor FlgH
MKTGARQIVVLVVLTVCMLSLGEAKTKAKNEEQVRAEYLHRVTQSATPVEAAGLGSLWVQGGLLTNAASDYKAMRLHDTIIIQVVQQTTAAASGTTNTQRAYDTSSAITALPGRLKVSGVNPLYAANSATKLQGQGQISSASTLRTSLAGQVIAVLVNGNLVVEAQREVLLNHERETAIVRGVVRPGDIGPNNTVLSTSLADLEVELKGKGVISDATRRPNLLARTLEWLLTF